MLPAGAQSAPQCSPFVWCKPALLAWCAVGLVSAGGEHARSAVHARRVFPVSCLDLVLSRIATLARDRPHASSRQAWVARFAQAGQRIVREHGAGLAVVYAVVVVGAGSLVFEMSAHGACLARRGAHRQIGVKSSAAHFARVGETRFVGPLARGASLALIVGGETRFGGDHLPAEQSWSHTAIEVWPAPATENLPAAQAWHWSSEERPVWAENLPAEQSWSHTAIKVWPAPAMENLPAAQAWHWSSEERARFFDHLPAAQAWH